MLVEQTEFVAVPKGLLEVVAEQLLTLDETAPRASSQSAKRSCSSARTAFGSAS